MILLPFLATVLLIRILVCAHCDGFCGLISVLWFACANAYQCGSAVCLKHSWRPRLLLLPPFTIQASHGSFVTMAKIPRDARYRACSRDLLLFAYKILQITCGDLSSCTTKPDLPGVHCWNVKILSCLHTHLTTPTISPPSRYLLLKPHSLSCRGAKLCSRVGILRSIL